LGEGEEKKGKKEGTAEKNCANEGNEATGKMTEKGVTTKPKEYKVDGSGRDTGGEEKSAQTQSVAIRRIGTLTISVEDPRTKPGKKKRRGRKMGEALPKGG